MSAAPEASEVEAQRLEAQVFVALDRRLDPAAAAPIAVALSGGGDSLALLHLAVDWAAQRGRPVLALTVDHGLNPDSARWTAEAGEQARALGAAWKGLSWTGEKPVAGLEARARTARHALLGQAAREAGARVILMGHSADDVREGEVMRDLDTPGLGRLREWALSPAWPEGRNIFLLRPMLNLRRAALRAWLARRGAHWLDDPANEDPRFARVRARQALVPAHSRGSGVLGFGGAAAAAQASIQASADVSHDLMALARAAVFAPGFAATPRAPLFRGEPSVARWVLTALVMSVGGATTPPRGEELDRLLETLRTGGVGTLSGCRVQATNTIVTLQREAGRQGQPPRPEEPAAWVAQRFYAACGLYPDEASIPPPP